MSRPPGDVLDDPALVEAGDPAGILRQTASAAAQVRSSLRAAEEADLGPLLASGRPRAIVVTGMGGSGIAGDVLAAVCGAGSPAQVVTVHDYQLPGWAGAADLVVAVSCSGGTEETLAAAQEAVRRGCPLLAVGGKGSPLAEIAQQASAPFIAVEPAGMPRTTLWGLSVPPLVAAARLGCLAMPPGGYEAAAAELERISHACRPDSDTFVNPAKSLAVELAGTLPVIWGSTPLAGVAAYRFACQLNENAKHPAISGVLPEANHNQVVAFDGPFAPRPGGAEPGEGAQSPVPLRLVLLRDIGEHPQVARRREESARLAAERGIGVSELTARGEGPLERLASLVGLIDYASVYLAIGLGIDPAPIAAITELKARIAGEWASPAAR